MKKPTRYCPHCAMPLNSNNRTGVCFKCYGKHYTVVKMREERDAARSELRWYEANGVGRIARERKRQIIQEGWPDSHDDQHVNGELIDAAICYAKDGPQLRHDGAPEKWPWSLSWWKPKGRIRNLERAGALIAAEIDRLDRAAKIGAKP